MSSQSDWVASVSKIFCSDVVESRRDNQKLIWASSVMDKGMASKLSVCVWDPNIEVKSRREEVLID